MPKFCEACKVQGPIEPCPTGSRRLRNVLVGERIVVLCREHARIVLEENVSDLETLRQLTRSQQDRRAPIERRGALDRRIFPPRPEGRRRGSARRCTDTEC
jgi:hypothetical protein